MLAAFPYMVAVRNLAVAIVSQDHRNAQTGISA